MWTEEKPSIAPGRMKLVSVIGLVNQICHLFAWQSDLSAEALLNCSATQVAVSSREGYGLAL